MIPCSARRKKVSFLFQVSSLLSETHRVHGDPQHTDGAQSGDGGSSVGGMVLTPVELEAAADMKLL